MTYTLPLFVFFFHSSKIKCSILVLFFCFSESAPSFHVRELYIIRSCHQDDSSVVLFSGCWHRLAVAILSQPVKVQRRCHVATCHTTTHVDLTIQKLSARHLFCLGMHSVEPPHKTSSFRFACRQKSVPGQSARNSSSIPTHRLSYKHNTFPPVFHQGAGKAASPLRITHPCPFRNDVAAACNPSFISSKASTFR